VAAAPEVLHRVNSALDGLASALESGDPDAVLAAEVPLATAVTALASLPAMIGATSSPELALALLNTRLAVSRCLALGRSSSDLLAVVTSTPGYGPAGRVHRRAERSSTVESRS
jgi:hypothetical protein